MVTVALYAPDTMPAVFTDTLTLPGAVPLAGLTASQAPPETAAV